MTDDAESARILFAQQCDCLLAAAEPAQFPHSSLPEVSFIGRSNVGKSSLINALTGRKGLARASNTPGRTQQIVFFDLGHRLMLTDLPGYGHAEAPWEEKEHWTKLVQFYLKQRRGLECVCLLLDGRHGVKANDIDMMSFLDRAAVSYQIVLTKMDQLRGSDHEIKRHQIQELLSKHPAARSDVIFTSAETRSGIDHLRIFLASIAHKEKPLAQR